MKNKSLRAIILLCLLLVLTISFKIKKTTNTPYNILESKRLVYYAGLAFCGPNCLIDWNCKWSKQVIDFSDITVINNNLAQMHGFIGYDSKLNAIILAFRGSVNPRNWIQDLSFQTTAYSLCPSCRIHRGFLQTYRSQATTINNKIVQLMRKYPSARIISTGHSLGAALSTICAIEIQHYLNIPSQKIQIHNFGSPRIGNSALAKYIAAKIQNRFRVVHNRDLVPHLPPEVFEYRHMAYQIFFDLEMQNYQVCDASGEDHKCSNKYAPNYTPDQHEFYFIDLGHVQC